MAGKIINFEKKLVVPKVWVDLLAIESFEELDETPRKTSSLGRPVDVADSTPYRDDCREIGITEGEYSVIMMLVSGDCCYWIDFSAFRNGDCIHSGCTEVEFEIHEGASDLPICDTEVNAFAFETEIEKAA